MTESWRPTASPGALERRAAMLAAARKFFADRGVLEVETPILSAAAASDPQIESLRTQIAGVPAPAYLCTSPEFAMKRLLAAGSGDIYQICKVFRDAERGRWHNPEFTMIEWYRLGFDDAALMTEVEKFIGDVLAPCRLLEPAERLSYAAALQRHAGVDADRASDGDLGAAAARHGIVCHAELDRDARLDLLMGMVAGPLMGRGRPTFVYDYPASQAALARLKPSRVPPVAARFELYLDGLELANGFHELGSSGEQRARFTRDLTVRGMRGQAQPPVDEHLLAALDALPECAGVALGFDRLVAIAVGGRSLADTLAFTTDNA
jgi:elongation factor P--(R)-beta-lysine ligase